MKAKRRQQWLQVGELLRSSTVTLCYSEPGPVLPTLDQKPVNPQPETERVLLTWVLTTMHAAREHHQHPSFLGLWNGLSHGLGLFTLILIQDSLFATKSKRKQTKTQTKQPMYPQRTRRAAPNLAVLSAFLCWWQRSLNKSSRIHMTSSFLPPSKTKSLYCHSKYSSHICTTHNPFIQLEFKHASWQKQEKK